jgi:hypothetical protein
MPKPAKKPPSKKKTVKSTKVSWWRKPPVLIALVFVVIAALVFANYAYSNWSNKQLIVGISDDFPELIAQIEQATSLELEISSDCMQTTEKFTEGVKVCGITAFQGIEEADKYTIKQAVIKSKRFAVDKEFDIQEGFYLDYKGVECTVAFRSSNFNPRVVLTCLIAPRSANEQLALEKLNAEYLNARKDFFRSNL